MLRSVDRHDQPIGPGGTEDKQGPLSGTHPQEAAPSPEKAPQLLIVMSVENH